MEPRLDVEAFRKKRHVNTMFEKEGGHILLNQSQIINLHYISISPSTIW